MISKLYFPFMVAATLGLLTITAAATAAPDAGASRATAESSNTSQADYEVAPDPDTSAFRLAGYAPDDVTPFEEEMDPVAAVAPTTSPQYYYTAPDPGWVPIVGAEATFLWPSANRAACTASIVDLDTATTYTATSNGAANDAMCFAPRLWVGAKRGRVGIVSRYWEMNNSVDSITALPPGIVAVGSAANGGTNAYAIDLEGMLDWEIGACMTHLSLGARYAYLNTNGFATINGRFAGPDTANATALTSRSTYGTGLTFAWSGLRPFERRPSIGFFWNVRGSVLWGQANAAAFTSAGVTANPAAAASTSNNALAGTLQETLFIGEVQLGLQCEHELKCLPALAFLRVACEYQYWDGTGNLGAGAFSLATTAPGGAGAGAWANAGGLNMNLVGISVGAGLTY